MIKNKGKIGEMRVVRLVSEIVSAEDKCDFTRHTNTNTADGGADVVLEHVPDLHQKLITIASGNDLSTDISCSNTSKSVKTRIDVKTTDSKISKDTVVKFGGDIRRNPDCKGHMLLGGAGLTRGAKKEFDKIKHASDEVGKQVSYVSNEGLANLETHYTSLPKPETESNNS